MEHGVGINGTRLRRSAVWSFAVNTHVCVPPFGSGEFLGPSSWRFDDQRVSCPPQRLPSSVCLPVRRHCRPSLSVHRARVCHGGDARVCARDTCAAEQEKIGEQRRAGAPGPPVAGGQLQPRHAGKQINGRETAVERLLVFVWPSAI